MKKCRKRILKRSSENKLQQDYRHHALFVIHKKERTRYALSASVRLHDGIL